MTLLAMVNKSTLVSNDDVATMARACADQLRLHAAPSWGLAPVPVVFYASDGDVPPGSVVLGIMDDSDQAGALGWHTEDADGTEYGRIFARPVLDNGGDALTKPLSVASVASHEVLEWFVDPRCNGWWDAGNGTLYAAEVCDPVESDSYTVTVDGVATPVTVSNFITPDWGDPQAASGAKLDWLGRLQRPFTMTPGGYVISRSAGDEQQQVQRGEDYPAWRIATKDHQLSRTSRRQSADNGRW